MKTGQCRAELCELPRKAWKQRKRRASASLIKIKQPVFYLLINFTFAGYLFLFYFLQQFLTWEFYVFCFVLYVMLIQDAIISGSQGEEKHKLAYLLTAGGFALIVILSLVEHFALQRRSFIISLAGIFLCVAAFVLRYYGIKNLGDYFSETVFVQDKHKLVTSGLYRTVRHPIYLGSIFLVIGLPLVVNAYYALAASTLEIVFILFRTSLEEKTLCAELPRYKKYKSKTNMFFPGWTK